MRLITVRTPEGHSQKVADIAFKVGIFQVSYQQAKVLFSKNPTKVQDVIEIETSTPKAKEFIEALTTSSFYDPESYKFSIQHPESLFASERIEKESHPIPRPTSDVYEELWQFSKVTKSMVARVFLSSLLLAYGMKENYLPLIIAALLFLPYHHHMLTTSLGVTIKEWKFFRQGLYAILISTLCIALAGACVAFLVEPGIKFTEFQSSPMTSFLIAATIGIAAGFASIDDAGRRELIGLAATAHISVYPAWFGLKFIFGFSPFDKPVEHFLIFLMDVIVLMIFAGITFHLMKMKGDGIRKFVKKMNEIRPAR